MKSLLLVTSLGGWMLAASAATPLSHGDSQVGQMLRDRPAMSAYQTTDGAVRKVTPEDAIWVEAAQTYEQKIAGSTIDWDASPLQHKQPVAAEHSNPWQGYPALIRLRSEIVKDGREAPASFEELWSHGVFELFNVANDEEFLAIYQRALRGEISRPEWLELNTRLEFAALVKLRNYYAEIWKPWCDRNHVACHEALWLRGFSAHTTYEEWFTTYQKSSSPYLSIWGSYYDQEIAPYLSKVKAYRANTSAR